MCVACECRVTLEAGNPMMEHCTWAEEDARSGNDADISYLGVPPRVSVEHVQPLEHVQVVNSALAVQSERPACTGVSECIVTKLMLQTFAGMVLA